MIIKIGEKVKHIPTGDIVIVKSKTKIFVQGIIKDHEQDWMCDKPTKVRISECESYIEPPKEKSFYDKMRERNMEDAKALPISPQSVDQHILHLKMAVMDRIEKIENRAGKEIYTFRKGKFEDPDHKFGFSEHYVNLLMHYAYEQGKKNTEDRLTRHFESSTRDMKKAIDHIISALDDNDLLPDYDRDNY
jgi:hypothetical protein